MRLEAVILVLLLVLAPASFVAVAGTSAHAQAQRPDKVYRIGYLRAGSPPKAWVEALRQGLRELGYVDGQNIVIEFPGTDASADDLPRLAKELVRSRVDVIVVPGAPVALAAKAATTQVPIVHTIVYDPVELGLVQSFGRPGGNITGLAVASAELYGKRLGLVRELVPKLRRVAVLSDETNPSHRFQMKGVEVAARALGIPLKPVPVRGPNDFDPGFRAMRDTDGLLVLDSALFTNHRARFAALAISSKLPAIYGYSEFVDAEGLASYGAHFPDMHRRAASYVDKILKGAKPGDLPVVMRRRGPAVAPPNNMFERPARSHPLAAAAQPAR